MKKIWFLKILAKILANKTSTKQLSNALLSNGNNNTLPLKKLTYISEIVRNFSKNYWKCERKQSNVHKTLNLDNSL